MTASLFWFEAAAGVVAIRSLFALVFLIQCSPFEFSKSGYKPNKAALFSTMMMFSTSFPSVWFWFPQFWCLQVDWHSLLNNFHNIDNIVSFSPNSLWLFFGKSRAWRLFILIWLPLFSFRFWYYIKCVFKSMFDCFFIQGSILIRIFI